MKLNKNDQDEFIQSFFFTDETGVFDQGQFKVTEVFL